MKRNLYLIRHGETTGQSAVRLNGSTDVPLNDHGREQMRRAGRALSHLAFDQVLVSPLSRSREGGDLVMGGRPPTPRIVEGFREVDFGDWEGLTIEEALARHPHFMEDYRSGRRDFQYPGGDTREGFYGRVAETAQAEFQDPPDHTLCVLHKGVIKAITGTLLGLPVAEAMAQPIEFGCIYHLQKANGAWRLLARNQTDHLDDVRMPESE